MDTRIFDSTFRVVILAAAVLLATPARAENCISMVLKTAKYSMSKTARVATAWKTESVVNPTTGMHESKQVPTAWTTETVSMGTFVGIAEVIAALKNDTAPGVAYKITQPTTIYAAAVPVKVPAGSVCIDPIDDRLLINRPYYLLVK